MSDDPTAEGQGFVAERKAKHRQRRRILLIIGGAVLLLIVLLVAGAFVYGWYWQSKLDAKIAELRSQGKLMTWQQVLDRCKGLPPMENSALVYQGAFKQLSPDSQWFVVTVLEYEDALGTRPSPTLMKLSGVEAKENAQGLKTILSAAPLREGCYPLRSANKPWDILFRDAQKARNAVRLCGRVAIYHAAEGRPGAAAPYLLAELGLASSLDSKTFLIEHLVRIACDSIALASVQSCLALCQLPAQDLKALR